MSEKEQEAKEQDEYDAWVGRERPHKFKNLSQSLADVRFFPYCIHNAAT